MGLTGKDGKFRTKILFIIGMMLAGIAAVITLSLFTMKREMFEDRKVKTKHVVEAAYGVLEHYGRLAKAGGMTEAEAQAAAAQVIKGLRYDGKEYFWINVDRTPVPTMIMHPTVPSLDGKVLDDAKFNCATSLQEGADGMVRKTDGRMNLFSAFVQVAKASGHGYVTYDWQAVTAAAILQFVADQVAHYKQLRHVTFIDTVPKSPSGKILRRLLRDRSPA